MHEIRQEEVIQRQIMDHIHEWDAKNQLNSPNSGLPVFVSLHSHHSIRSSLVHGLNVKHEHETTFFAARLF
jgi:hypothetical protein